MLLIVLSVSIVHCVFYFFYVNYYLYTGSLVSALVFYCDGAFYNFYNDFLVGLQSLKSSCIGVCMQSVKQVSEMGRSLVSTTHDRRSTTFLRQRIWVQAGQRGIAHS